MKKIENIRITSWPSTTNFLDQGVNNAFRKQREEHKEYDAYLLELKELLKDETKEYAKKVYDVLFYNGKFVEIIQGVMPRINAIYNEGYTPLECKNKLLNNILPKGVYSIYYEHIECKDIDAIAAYLDFLEEAECRFLSCKVDDGNTLSTVEEVRKNLLTATKVVLDTAVVGLNSKPTLIRFWKEHGSKDLKYRCIKECDGTTIYYKGSDEIKQVETTGMLTTSDWYFPYLQIQIEGEVDSIYNQTYRAFADKYNLNYTKEYPTYRRIYGRLDCNRDNLYILLNDLDKLIHLNRIVTIEGIASASNYIEEAIQLMIKDSKVVLKVIHF